MSSYKQLLRGVLFGSTKYTSESTPPGKVGGVLAYLRPKWVPHLANCFPPFILVRVASGTIPVKHKREERPVGKRSRKDIHKLLGSSQSWTVMCSLEACYKCILRPVIVIHM